MAKKITSLLGLGLSLQQLAKSAGKLRKKIAEELEADVESRIVDKGENAAGSSIGTYSASTTRVKGKSGRMNLVDTGDLRKAFGIDRRLSAPDFKFGSERKKAEIIEQGGKTRSINAPVFEFTDEEIEKINSIIKKELTNLGLA